MTDDEIAALELALKRAKKERASLRKKAALADPAVRAKMSAASELQQAPVDPYEAMLFGRKRRVAA